MNQEQIVRVFKALANENRLRILEAIISSDTPCKFCPEDLGLTDMKQGSICCVDEIVGQFDMAQSTISQHLKELYDAGLLERHKKAQWVYYTVSRARFQEIAEYLRQFSSDFARKK
ncbi:winged helix-turn-helix transcriptional regulator [Candidatus Poribacteria bacterium]|nr:winged helix-turn-helix transcriptional regulator [Candidatus Poribacteria bacterium]